MAPRRVAAALAASGDDTLEDSIREVLARGETDPEADPETDPEADPETDPEADPETDPEADPETDPEVDPETAPRQRVTARRQREPDDGHLSPEAEQRIAAAERMAADTQARYDTLMQQLGQPRETAEQEAARLATMTPEQIIDYKVGKAIGQVSQNFQRSTFAAQNSADKASFDASMVANPQLKRLAADVERRHADLVRENTRTGSGIPTRQMVLTYMLGEKALELAQRAAPQQQARQQRVQRQQVRPGTSRSDVAPSRRQSQTAEQRLENIQL